MLATTSGTHFPRKPENPYTVVPSTTRLTHEEVLGPWITSRLGLTVIVSTVPLRDAQPCTTLPSSMML